MRPLWLGPQARETVGSWHRLMTACGQDLTMDPDRFGEDEPTPVACEIRVARFTEHGHYASQDRTVWEVDCRTHGWVGPHGEYASPEQVVAAITGHAPEVDGWGLVGDVLARHAEVLEWAKARRAA